MRAHTHISHIQSKQLFKYIFLSYVYKQKIGQWEQVLFGQMSDVALRNGIGGLQCKL